jgi:predicted permease
MIFIKTAGILAAGFVAIIAALFCLASSLSYHDADDVEREHVLFTTFWGLVVFALCAGAIVSLSGCQAAKTVFDACADGVCR